MAFSIVAGLRRAIADPDVAIDLGTANTRLYAMGRGVIAEEPSLVRIDSQTGAVTAIGASAKLPGKSASHSVAPLRAGVVTDVGAAVELLKPLLRRARRFGLIKPRVMTFAPTDACESERGALREAMLQAGASRVSISPEPLAAAIGAGLDITLPYAQMLVDIGDGVTDIAVVRSGALIATFAIRTACSDLHAAVSSSVESNHKLLLYPQEAERIACRVGAVRKNVPRESFKVLGTDKQTGLERSISIENYEVFEALDPVIGAIVDAVRHFVRDLPHTTACEVIESGICLTGGGAGLPGLAGLIASKTSLDVKPAVDPLRAVINGARHMLSVGLATGVWAQG